MKKIKIDLKKQNEKMKDIEYVKKLYKRSQRELLAVFLLFAAVFYFNYNYIAFKIKLASEFLYTQSLDELAQEHLKKDFSWRDMDALTIAVYGEKLKEDDKYFQLFGRGEFKGELKEMEKLGSDTKVEKTADGKAVIDFTLFTPRAFKNVKKDIDTLETCDTVMIDLRGNTGGMVSTAEKFASLFLNKGDIIYSCEEKNRKKTVRNKKQPQLTPTKIIILQDEWTASASELFIMALKENLDNVTVVGTKSYGKGVGQNEYFLADGYGFKFTAMRILTPSGGSINGKGITPDIEYSGEDMLAFAEKLKTE